MTTRFKRKTLAVSIAAALFGGMALSVAPIMTPVALADQFEASNLGPRTSTNLYTGDPKNGDDARTGFIEIQERGTPWNDEGFFIVTFPKGTRFWDEDAKAMVADPLEDGALINSFEISNRKGIDDLEAYSAAYNAAGQLEVKFELETRHATEPRVFRIQAYASLPTVGDLRVKIADDAIDPVGLDTLAGQPDNGIEIAKFFNTTAVIGDIVPTSVQSGQTNQPVADIPTELLATTSNKPRILFTLNNGTWADLSAATVGGPSGALNKLNDTQLELVRSSPWKPNDKPTLMGLKINAAGVPTDTDINVTVSSQAGNGFDAIPNFGTHPVKVARTKGTAGKDITVGLTTDPTKDVLYVDRYYQTLTNAVTLAEAMPGTLIPNGTLNYTLSTGVFNTSSVLGVAGTGTAPTCAPIGATASAKFECTAAGSATTTAGAWTLTPSLLNSGPFNMNNATVGDLNVTIDGTAWTNWTSNVVKLADVKKATTSTIDGNVAVLRLGGGTVSTQRTLPDIVIQENNAGALIGNEYFVVAIDEGLKLNVLPTTEVKVFDKNDTDTGVTLTSSVDSPSWLIGTGTGDPRGIDIQWTSTLPAANGPYKIVISGLQVEGDPSSTSPGDYNLSVAGSLLNQHVADRVQSDRYAKPYYEIFPAVKVIDNLTTTAWVDASGPIDDLSAYSSILPGIAARDKLGSYYLMLQMPPQFTGDWSLWTLGAAGWTMVEPAPTMEELCRTMTSYRNGALVDVINMPLVVNTDMTVFKDVSVWTGFGVGAPLPDPMVPCLNMFENSTYWYVYTVQ